MPKSDPGAWVVHKDDHPYVAAKKIVEEVLEDFRAREGLQSKKLMDCEVTPYHMKRVCEAIKLLCGG